MEIVMYGYLYQMIMLYMPGFQEIVVMLIVL